MTLTEIPHRVINSLRDSTANWEWLRNNGVSQAELEAVSADADTRLPASTWRTLWDGYGAMPLDATAGAYLYRSGGVVMATSGVAAAHPLSVKTFYIVGADYAVTGKTTQLRQRVWADVNGIAPGHNLLFRMYPATSSGAADTLTITAGVPVDTATITTPALSTITVGVGSAFTIPSDGAYVLGCAVPAATTMANNSFVACHTHLQIRHT